MKQFYVGLNISKQIFSREKLQNIVNDWNNDVLLEDDVITKTYKYFFISENDKTDEFVIYKFVGLEYIFDMFASLIDATNKRLDNPSIIYFVNEFMKKNDFNDFILYFQKVFVENKIENYGIQNVTFTLDYFND